MDLESKTKKYIISLLQSTPLVITLQQLSKDYTNTIGEPIPYQRLGYNSLEHFLRSIPDTVGIRGSGGTAEVIPVVSDKSAHINMLVTKQRVSKPKDRRHQSNQRRRYASHAPPPMRMGARPVIATPSTEVPLARKIFYPSVSTLTASSSSNVSTQNLGSHNNVTKTSGLETRNTEVSVNAPKISLPEKVPKNEPVIESRKQDEKKLYERPIYETKHKSEDKTERSTSNEVKKCTTNVKNLLKKITPDKNKLCTEQLESNVPYPVRCNLRRLISQCHQGIWCAEVPKMYRSMFRQDLNYQELGFRSLIDLCVCLSSIFHYVRPSTEDFKLYDRSKPLPDCAERKFTVASYDITSTKNSERDTTALPSIDWTDVRIFLPKGILKPGEEIPRAFIPMELVDDELEIDVVVGEIYDLSKFWIYLQDSLLDTLMDNIQEFYKDHALEYQIPEHLMKEGLYCVQIIFGEYHRALIVDVMPDVEDTIRVIFIDYGTMTKVPTKGVCFLHEDFAHLPAQAIRCRLANIFPLEEGLPWSKEASKAFRKMVAKRDMSVKISHINWEDQFLEVYLLDVTDEHNIFYINDRLVNEGFAQYPHKDRKKTFVDPIYTPIVKFIHLFPTFLELEHGLAPSTAEMSILNECEVPINFCYPQYFYVDYSFEEEIIRAAEEFHVKNCMRGKRRTPARDYDLDRFKSQEMDLSIFGELEAEITEFLNRNAEHVLPDTSEEDYVDADEEDFDAKLDVITERFKYLSTKEEETVSVLKQDLLMTENIMNDINGLGKFNLGDERVVECNQSEIEDLQREYSEFEGDYYQEQPWELCTINEAGEVEDSMGFYEEHQDRLVEDSDYSRMVFPDHPLNKLTFNKCRSLEGGSSSSNSPRSDHSPDSKRTDYDLQQSNVWGRPMNFSFLSTNNTSLDSEKGGHVPIKWSEGDTPRSDDKLFGNNLSYSSDSLDDSDKKEMVAKTASTNPFLQDVAETTDNMTDLPPGLKLNRNNPFLTFLSEKNGKTSSESSRESTTSTSYESPTTYSNNHSWSNFDDLSPETITQLGRALNSSSCSSTRTSDTAYSCSTSTQTTNVAPPDQTRTPPPPYFGQQQPIPYNYPTNPYYNVRFGNYPTCPYDPTYGAAYPYRRPGIPPGFGPPPGFAPIAPNAIVPFAQATTYYPRQEDIRQLPYYATGAPLRQVAPMQFNGIARTTSLSAVSVSVVSDKDFYDVYNERLRLQGNGESQ